MKTTRTPLTFIAALATLSLIHHAEAAGRSAPSIYSAEWSGSAPGQNWGGDVVAEAARYVGSGNPTGFREAWCRDFINMVLERTGHRLADKSHVVAGALNLGPRVASPASGDLAVMRGHVTIFVGWAGQGTFLGLGGNQGHRVRVSRFALRSVVAFVRPS